MSDTLVRLFGWRATFLHGDPSVYDRWRWVRKHLTAGPIRTFDAGCGSGSFSIFAAKMGNNVLGLSFDEWNDQKARRRAQLVGATTATFRRGDLRELESFGPELGTFDQILCLETIEHILDDRKLIHELAKLLRPGGRILLTTPYKHYHPLRGDKVSDVENGDHVRWGYTHDEIAALFAAEGIDTVSREYISGVVTQKTMNLMRVLDQVDHRLSYAATFPLRVLRPIDTPLTRATSYPALSIGVVGVKRA
jgi:2-polyprenyl-3-methyl-5-hydroxy-6-metoxy-1,4-benzoquinol methylase